MLPMWCWYVARSTRSGWYELFTFEFATRRRGEYFGLCRPAQKIVVYRIMDALPTRQCAGTLCRSLPSCGHALGTVAKRYACDRQSGMGATCARTFGSYAIVFLKEFAMFQHWIFWLIVTVLVLVVLFVAKERGFSDKINGSVSGQKRWLGFDTAWWEKNFNRVALAVIIAGFMLMLFGCSSGTTAPAPVAEVFNCQGKYVGTYDPPSHEERIRLRNQSLSLRGIAITADEEENNRNAGGGAPDGGIWMGGSYSFETDASCKVVNGSTMVFYSYPYEIIGAIGQDRTFNLTWQGSGSAGRMDGKVEANNTISGTFHHPAPEDYIYGVLNGTFTPTK